MQNNPLTGAQYLLDGFRLLSTKRLRSFVILPLIINIGLYSALVYYSIDQLQTVSDRLLGDLPSWADFLYGIFWLLIGLTVFVLVAMTFNILANFIAAPLNGLLSERTEATVDQFNGKPMTWGQAVPVVIHALGRELKKLAYYLPRALGLLLISVIPGSQLITPILWFLLAAWMMAIQYMDYPMDNHGFSFQTLRQTLSQRRSLALGFGSAVMVSLMIPVFNLFVMPAAVMGATLMWIKEFKINESIL